MPTPWILERIVVTPRWRAVRSCIAYGMLVKRVHILPIVISYARGAKPRGGYQVDLVWKNFFNMEERSKIGVIVSKENGPRFLLAISKLAPQAEICVYNFNKAKLPSKL
jgi:hypothetical protein